MYTHYFRKHVYSACKTAVEYVQDKFGLITNQHNSKFCLTSMSMLVFLLYTEIFSKEELNDTLLISFTLIVTNISIERIFMNTCEVTARVFYHKILCRRKKK